MVTSGAKCAPGLLLALAVGCGDSTAVEPPVLEPARPGADPSGLGHYRVGVTTFETTDGEEGGRTFSVEVWYPTSAVDLPLATYAITAGEFVLVELDSPNQAQRDAPVDYRGAPHPVVVFSHGSQGIRMQSVYLTEYLASHGFVVAAPDHVGNTFTQSGATTLESARVRPIDVTRTLDALLARSDGWPDELLAFSADPDRIGVAGHSFGGFTAFRSAGATIDVSIGDAVCEADPGQFFCDGWPSDKEIPASAVDPRFIAALPQAPGGAAVFQGDGYHDIGIPVMIQAGTADRTTPFESEARLPFDELQSEAYLLSIEDAGHFTFSDLCTLVDAIGLSIEQIEDGCGEDNIPFVEAHRIVNRAATSFFKVFVAHDDTFDYAKELTSVEGPATLEAN